MNIKRKICFLGLIVGIIFNYSITANALILTKEREVKVNSEFIGTWNMQTVVTSSNSPYILTGTTTESKLEIKAPIKTNSILTGLWKGGNWTKSIGTIKLLNNKEAITERVTNIKTNGNSWKSVLIDHLKLTEDNLIQSESIVIQYKNNEFVGEYKTFSILTKLD